MRHLKFLGLLSLVILSLTPVMAQEDDDSITWLINRTDSMGGFNVTRLNEFPEIIETQTCTAALFDGINDGMLIDATEFTIEVFFKPASSLNPANKEQRFIHIRNGSNDNRRILIELRLYPSPPANGEASQRWALDTFIKSENSRCALLDSSINHRVGDWYNVALVYKDGMMTHYVNNKKELQGKVEYLPIVNGKISIGARQDPRNWFKGAIKIIRFTKKALEPKDFLSAPL